jgi:hypothetical protein
MSKPYGSGPTQLSPNDRLGRFAYLDELPPDVLKDLQDLPWHFQNGTQVEDDGTDVGSKQIANKQYVLDRLNSSQLVPLTDQAQITATEEQLAARTLIFTGQLNAGSVFILPDNGQWFLVNRCMGDGPITIRGNVTLQQVVLQQGENAAVYVDNQGVSVLSTSSASFINYYPFTATANQTEFDFPYSPYLVLGFSAGQAYMPSQDFDASSGSKVVLKQPAAAGSQWVFVAFTATTIANALPISGGVMQGALQLADGSTASTAPVGANDNRIATMAAIFQAKRVIAEVIPVTGTTFTVDSGSIGATFSLQSNANSVIELPDLLSTFPNGWFDFVNTSSTGYAQLVGDVGFNWVDPYSGQLVSKFVVGPGESIRIICNQNAGLWQLGVGLAKLQGRILSVKSYLQAGIYTYSRTPGTRQLLLYGAGAGAASGGLPACAQGYVAVAQAGSPGAKAFAIYEAGFDTAIVTVGAGGPSSGPVDSGQVGEDGGISSFGTLLTLPGGKGGSFAITNSSAGVTAFTGSGSNQPAGSGIVSSSYGILAPAAFINTAGMFGGIEINGEGLEGNSNGLGGAGQYTNTSAATPSTATNAGEDGGFILYELS